MPWIEVILSGTVAEAKIEAPVHNMENREHMDEQSATEMLGMSEAELYAYLSDLLHEEAAEEAARSGTDVDKELGSPGFAAAEAASTYAIRLVLANNAYLTRQLLDLGVLQPPDA
jgi:class 3 adenylate cyclase